MERIRLPFEVKAIDADGMGFEGLLSAWTVDKGNDRVMKGAFKRTLSHWREAKGRRVIPLIDQHQYSSIFHVIGKLADADEQEAGLWTKWAMIPDDDIAARAHRRVKGGFVSEMSMGYESVRHDYTEMKVEGRPKRIRNLHEVKLGEGSLVIWAMQPDALIDPASVKAAADTIEEEIKSLSERLAALRARLTHTESSSLAPTDPPPRPVGTHGSSRADELRTLKLRALRVGI